MIDLSRKILYVRIHPDVLSVRDVKSGRSVEEPPVIAIRGGLQVDGTNPEPLAVGRDALKFADESRTNLVNPFAHPRTPLSDFTSAEYLLKGFIRKLRGHSFWVRAPIVVLHLIPNLQGDITQIEIRALLELGKGAGALRAYGWLGPDLTDEQLTTLKFPGTGKAF